MPNSGVGGRLARRTTDAAQARRLGPCLDDYSGSQPDGAQVGSIQIDRVMRFNAHGPRGLINGKFPGLPSRLNNHQHENWLSNRISTRTSSLIAGRSGSSSKASLGASCPSARK